MLRWLRRGKPHTGQAAWCTPTLSGVKVAGYYALKQVRFGRHKGQWVVHKRRPLELRDDGYKHG